MHRRRARTLRFVLVISMIGALMTVPLSGSAGQGFYDDDNSVFETDIEALANAGITSGCNPTDFCPNDPVSRGQMAAFLVRALGLTDRGSVDFVDDNSSVFEADIEKLATAGITAGCNPPTNNQFCPNDNVTRGQMAAFLTRALDLPKEIPAGFAVGEDDLALVGSFWVEEADEGDKPEVERMKYWPRAFKVGLDIDPDMYSVDTVDSTGRYAGWDVLSPSTKWEYKNLSAKNDWMHFTLNRDATVAVVWRDEIPLPSWLSGWTEGGTVAIDGDLVPVYEKDYAAGEVVLGSVEYTTEWREMYLILLSEADGNPTATPTVPDEFTAPVTNTLCPSWVHGMYTTTGPDGATYETWHPQIDPHYWCYFGHDHGSNPDLIPGSPKVPYGYVADKLSQDEPNVGFKEFIFQDMDGEHWVRFVIHASTHDVRRVCAQFHTLYIEVYDLAGVQLYATGFKADYGAAFATSDTGNGVLTPTNCGYSMPGLVNTVSDHQNREINVGSASNNYERWDSREETAATFNLGISSFDHQFDIRDPQSHCASATCNSVIIRDPLDDNSTRRTLGMASWRGDFLFDADHALGSGEFYTDPFALAVRSAGNADAVRQYVAPGFSLDFVRNATANNIDCVADEPWMFEYTCYQLGGTGNLEHLPSPPDMAIEDSLWRN